MLFLREITLKYRSLTLIVGASIAISSCSDSGVNCSSEGVEELLVDMIKEDLKKDQNIQYGFNIDGSRFTVNGIRTKADTASGKSCAAALDMEFELTDQLKQIRENNPAGFQSLMSNNYREFNNTKRQYNLQYTVEKTDDGQVYVEIQF